MQGRSAEYMNSINKNTRFSSTNQPKNRRPKTVLTQLRKQIHSGMDTMKFKQVYVLDEKGKRTGQIVHGEIKMPTSDALIIAAVRKAMRGDTQMMKLIFQVDDTVARREEETMGTEAPLVGNQPATLTESALKQLADICEAIIIEDV